MIYMVGILLFFKDAAILENIDKGSGNGFKSNKRIFNLSRN